MSDRSKDELKPETIVRVSRHARDFVVIANATVQDERLSWEARGLLAYLLSLPSDWEIRVSHLVKQGSAGRDAVRRMLRELQTFGYASGVGRESQGRVEHGRFGQTEIAVYETPALNPFFQAVGAPSPEIQSTATRPPAVEPLPDSPSPENPATYKEQNPQKTQRTNHTPTKTRLRAVGAPAGVGVSIFSPEFRDKYADHFKLEEGWRVRGGTGEYDERIVSAIRRNSLFRLAATWGTEADAAHIAELAPSPGSAEEPKQGGDTAPPLIRFEIAASYVRSMMQCPGYNVAGYIEQMSNVSEETRAALRTEFLEKPAAQARTA